MKNNIPNIDSTEKYIPYRSAIMIVALLVFAGCKSTSYLPEPRPLGAQYKSAGQDDKETETTISESTGNLKLEEALALALLKNPELVSFSYAVRSAEARILQTRARPNPYLEFKVGEFDRNGEGFDSTESAIILGQVIELGRKRTYRTRIAKTQGRLAGWDYESKRLEVFTKTTTLFMSVISAKQRLELSQEALALAEKTHKAAKDRVAAGKEPPFHASKTEAELELTKISKTETENALALAKRKLAAMWGSEKPLFNSVEGNINQISSVPPMTVLRAKLKQNPALARWDDEIKLRKAILSSEKAAIIPDLKGNLGYQSYAEDDSDAFLLGIGIDLPLYKKSRGGIVAAGHDLAKTEQEAKNAELKLAAELTEAHSNLTTAHSKITALQTKVIPAMEEAFNAAQEGYIQGKFNFMDMLDAQRSLFKVKTTAVQALLKYHAASAEIQRITGTSIEELNKPNKETK